MAKKRTKEGFEEHLEALERLVDELESGELTLEGSMERYQEGVERLKTCYEMLRKAEQQVKILVRDTDGELREEPFGSEEA
ncbi:MAG: exodeoxyribonuclease VII small subunit [Planctomycetota bacterium]|jgi:exodeoxyribonuclease VII small subunit